MPQLRQMNLGSSVPLKGTDKNYHNPMEAIWENNTGGSRGSQTDPGFQAI